MADESPYPLIGGWRNGADVEGLEGDLGARLLADRSRLRLDAAEDPLDLLGREIAELEAQIKTATKERDALRVASVANGWATWSYTVRMSAPSLAWWKENRPTVWKKYAKETSVKKFTLV